MSAPSSPFPPSQLRAVPVLDLAAEEALLGGVLWRRVVGFWIDLLLIGLLVVLLWAGLMALGLPTLGLSWMALAGLPAVPPLYHFLSLLRSAAATPGQRLLGLTVRRIEDFSRPDAADALVSVLGFYATLALGTIWLGIALFTRQHRAVHDMLAGLVVVRRRGLAALTPPGGVWNMANGGKVGA